jgi:uncharacterized protein (TIGR00290 family)
MKEKAVFNWSGGKDSALALHKIINQKEYEVVSLLTSVSEQFQRISMHGVRVDLLEKQAKSIGLPLIKMQIPDMPDMNVYEKIMAGILTRVKNKGVTASVFGDIFLEDLRKYREEKLNELHLKAVFPLWKIPTKEIIKEFIGLGFKTITTCVNEKFLDKSFAGRIIDAEFLNDLPSHVDPCGENGEFHTFVFEGPLFKNPVAFQKGDIVYRKYTALEKKDDSSYNCGDDDPFSYGFWYCDLIPV